MKTRILRWAVPGCLFPLVMACSGADVHRDVEANPEVMVRKWTLPTHGPFEAGERGAEYSNAVVHENTLIFGSESVGVIAIYPTINQVRWVLPIEGGVSSEIAVAGGSVYFGGRDGYFYSVNLETGRVNWRYNVRNLQVSRPTVAGGRVFVTTHDDTVYAFDAGSGEWLWHFRRRSTAAATIHGASSPLVEGELVLAGLSDGFLVALSLHDGQLKWEKRLHTGTKFTDVDAHPVKDAGVVYVPSYDGSLYALGIRDQEILWRVDMGGSNNILLGKDRLYLPSSDGNVYALSKSSGKTLWKFALDAGVPTEIVETDKLLIFGSSHQYLYAIAKDSGQPVYRFNAGYGTGFYGQPTFVEDSRDLYILSGAGNLYSFRVRSGERKDWAHGSTSPYEFFDEL